MSALTLSNVNVSLNRQAVLNDVSLDFSAGEFVGLMGPNGSGKSTLMRAAAGLIGHKSGLVNVFGKSVDAWSRPELARAIAYLPQGGQVHWPLTVRALVTLGRLPHAHRFVRIAPQDQGVVERVMTACNVAHLADRPVTTLSGGERARALLARALAAEGKIVLADEPFAQLDPNHQLHAMEVLHSAAQKAALVIVVLHDMSIAARHCSRVVLLSQGSIVGDGTPTEVLNSETLRKTFGVDAFIGEYGGGPVITPVRRSA